MTALTAVDAGPLPPSYEEMAEAIMASHAEFYGVGPTEHVGTPADLTILSLGERLLACRQSTAQDVRSVDSGHLGGKSDC